MNMLRTFIKSKGFLTRFLLSKCVRYFKANNIALEKVKVFLKDSCFLKMLGMSKLIILD